MHSEMNLPLMICEVQGGGHFELKFFFFFFNFFWVLNLKICLSFFSMFFKTGPIVEVEVVKTLI